MPINNALIEVGAGAMRTAVTHLSLHSAQPNSSGSNETNAARVSASWGAVGDGSFTATNRAFTGGTPSGAVHSVGFWSAAEGGTFYGYSALDETSDVTFNAAGEYTVSSVSIDGSATGDNE